VQIKIITGKKKSFKLFIELVFMLKCNRNAPRKRFRAYLIPAELNPWNYYKLPQFI